MREKSPNEFTIAEKVNPQYVRNILVCERCGKIRRPATPGKWVGRDTGFVCPCTTNELRLPFILHMVEHDRLYVNAKACVIMGNMEMYYEALEELLKCEAKREDE